MRIASTIHFNSIEPIQKAFKLFLLLIFFWFSNSAIAQYRLSIGGNYIHSFGERTIVLQDVTYFLNSTHGYEVTANNAFRFRNTKLDGVFKIGYRQLFFSGNSATTSYYGRHNKLTGSLGLNYSLSNKFEAAAYIECENNLDFEQFFFGMGDLFRVSLSLEGTYTLTNKFGVTCLINRAMTPISPAYIFSNPQYQIRIGLSYQIL